MSEPMAFKDLPQTAFPFLVQYFRMDTDELVGWTAVTGPGVMKVVGHGDKGYPVEVVVWHPREKVATRTIPASDGRESVTSRADLDDDACETIMVLLKGVEDGVIENGDMEGYEQ